MPCGILIGGEELHNNHHAYATSARLSNKWYEFDIGWMYIRILEALGLAQVKKLAPRPRFAAAKPVVDLETLQAVIANRYDVLARYAKSLKQTYAEEVGKLQAVLAARRGGTARDSPLAAPRRARAARARARYARRGAGEVEGAGDGAFDAPRARRRVGALLGLARAAREPAPGLVPPRGRERHRAAARLLDQAAVLRVNA